MKPSDSLLTQRSLDAAMRKTMRAQLEAEATRRLIRTCYQVFGFVTLIGAITLAILLKP